MKYYLFITSIVYLIDIKKKKKFVRSRKKPLLSVLENCVSTHDTLMSK